jgi:DNA-binding response OmpR family regulator
MHALIIEQDMWVVLMIEDVLREVGYSSFSLASSPEAALAAASDRRPDLITSALRLGGGTAIDAVREICSANETPVVFVTATPWEVRAMDSEAVIVAKPFGQATLKAGVARAVAVPAV